ncbi:hypothetical protein K438DRAFT_2055631 [Mycena galopus ATCC 62051]|nr:hypothetical protein K438DRAFT_2055631 [Mycena galopus ATCC 62051]
MDDSDDFEDLLAETPRQLHRYPGQESSTKKTLNRILRLVGPSLVALHIHSTTVSRQSLFLEIDFPLLRELTLHGPFKSLYPPTGGLRPRAFFPSLWRIQIYHFAYRPAKFLQQIVQTAPLLTHLRVPQCSFTPYDIQVALGMLQPTIPDSDGVYLPRSVEKLVIEVDFLTSSLDSSAGNIRANQFLKKFQKIAASDSRVCLVDGRRDWMPVDQAKQEWLAQG